MSAPDVSPDFRVEIEISFGHCDPAGIVYYPNYFRWFDRCFHSFLQRRAGGHASLCAQLGAVGIGLMDVGARFPSPARDGDMMDLQLRLDEWRPKALKLGYTGVIDGRTVIEGHEIRGLFVPVEGRLRAGEMAPLRELIG